MTAGEVPTDHGPDSLQLQDLFDLDELQAIQDAFAAATGVASIITTTSGQPITRPSNFCELCTHIIRATPLGLANCIHSDATLGRPNPNGPTIQPCLSGGLFDAGASIMIGDHPIAVWMIGQVLDDSADERQLLAYARQIGADEQAYRAALANVTRMPRQQFAQIAQALFLITRQLSRLAIQNVQKAQEIAARQQAEAALEQERTLLRTIIDHLPDAIYAKDRQYRKILVNRADLQNMGIENPADVLGKTDFEVFPAELAEQFYADDQQIFATGQPLYNREELVGDHTGRRRWQLTSKIPLRDPGGEIIGIVGIGRDITARKLAEQAEREQRILAEALRDTATILTSTLELGEVLERILTNVSRVVPHDAANIMLVEDDMVRIIRYQVKPGANRPLSTDDLKFRMAEFATLTQMLETGRPLLVPDVSCYPGWIALPFGKWVNSYVGAPINIHNQTAGFLNLNSAQVNFYTNVHAERLQAFADQAAIALQNARMYIADPLTGLYNRRGLFKLGGQEFDAANQYARPFAALFIDIDHFRSFNERHGHAVGDLVLQTVAGRCRQSVRGVDLVGRYGGEEFVILLPETGLLDASRIAERLRLSVEKLLVPTERGELSVTISIGVATRSDNDTLERLLNRADQAMLVAKSSGRNRVEIDPST